MAFLFCFFLFFSHSIVHRAGGKGEHIADLAAKLRKKES